MMDSPWVGQGRFTWTAGSPWKDMWTALLRHSIKVLIFRVTTGMENLKMSGNLTAVREMSGILLKIREMSGGGNL